MISIYDMKKIIAQLLRDALGEEGVKLKEEEIEDFIEIPKFSEMGDYAFPCFFLTEKLKAEPREIALELRTHIKDIPIEFDDIQTSEAYINFFLNRKTLAKNLIKQILSQKEKFGSSNIGIGKKVLVEHTSINPNASPHVGRARNAIIGDSLVKIFEFLNFEPEVHYYVNNVSKQIAMLVLAKAEKLKFENMLKKYTEISRKVEKSKKLEKQVFELLKNFEQGDREIIKKFKKITDTCVKGQKEILSKLKIKYDIFDYESDYLKKSQRILKEFQKTKKLHKDKQGRLYLNQKNTQIEKKMKSPVLVLTRSDSTGLYPLRDIAYTIDKMKETENNIVVLGEDQKLYFQQITEALKLLNFKFPRVVHYSYILLSKKGKRKSKKMATRKGNVVLLEDFLNEVIKKAKEEISKRKTKGNSTLIGIGAVKYKILKNSPSKTILFDLNEALNFEGDTGPYIQYSYARASSILKKARNKKLKLNIIKLEPKEIELIKKLSQFPEFVLNAYKNLNPSVIANYSYQLAQIFNEFYHTCPVIKSEQMAFRLSLVESFRQVLKNSLTLLGIRTMEEM